MYILCGIQIIKTSAQCVRSSIIILVKNIFLLIFIDLKITIQSHLMGCILTRIKRSKYNNSDDFNKSYHVSPTWETKSQAISADDGPIIPPLNFSLLIKKNIN